ncbi:NAD-dependent epimerase/dehydratase family protein [Aspergillus novofumigatus IBT 16806]|uniref:NAD(P)-binding protein n=1 Tax=Aspergillus novofumigatus (strain IBT 16806) TaxID=1392255 RepID=A0A2I1BXB8_ASPN1|nr:NAD(P)-binding protein [Aspergillus novofumigatus IBT 16806]PKX90024.1 NAD(P)-binding protein [Aspergillus novofumigatus IBT 16806]
MSPPAWGCRSRYNQPLDTSTTPIHTASSQNEDSNHRSPRKRRTRRRQGVRGRRTHHCASEPNRAAPTGDTPNTEMRTADVAMNYQQTVEAFRGCDAVIHLAAIPNPVSKDDYVVHNNNVDSAFNGLRAAAEVGIKRFCYASSVNAIGLAFSNQPRRSPRHPTDSYALAKREAEIQAQAFAEWFPGMKVACLRIHEVSSLERVQKVHENDWENAGVKQLWGWVNPVATARACLLAVEKCDNWEGCEIFNIVAPTTTQDIPSEKLARKYFPDAEIRADMSGNQGFWTTDKAKRLMGWEHCETE